jgi:dinuclear metal center YbgI/SA1388 family protein
MPHPAPPPPPDAGATAPRDRLADWVDLLHELYPPAHAEPWDAVGLHVGDLDHDVVSGVLVALDVTAAVLDEAAAAGCDLLIAHHPLLFHPLGRLTGDTAAGRLALRAARLGVAVAAAHTNLDKAATGTSHPAATALGLRDVAPLEPLDEAGAAGSVKLVTFVPREATADVRDALAAAGAGIIGGYDACAFAAPGTGTFRPGPGTDPAVGRRGELTAVAEDRVEVVVSQAGVPAVLASLRQAHPYEEVPVDLYPLLPAPADGPPLGLGLVGDLPAALPLAELVPRLAAALDAPHVRLAAEDPSRPVTRVAVVGGAGGSLADAARRAGAEVLVTGDVSHHAALDARTMGLAVVDAGHWATEQPAMDGVADALAAAARDRGLTATVHRSDVRTDPWTSADPDMEGSA